MSRLPPPETNDERLDRILYHLERMDSRDRLRTVGGFFRSLIALIPMLIFVWSTWYFYQHSDEILQKIAGAAAQQAANVATGGRSTDELMQEMQKYMQR